jgi:hypothetical protein
MSTDQEHLTPRCAAMNEFRNFQSQLGFGEDGTWPLSRC